MRNTIAAMLLLAACGSRPAPQDPKVGAVEHLEEADRHDAEARALEEQATETPPEIAGAGCTDPVLADQVSSGGERVRSIGTCWEAGAGDARLRQAETLRADAEAHRARANELLAAETLACASMTEDQLETSVFDARDRVVSATVLLDGKTTRGARVELRAEGLTADAVRVAISCQQARAAALGWQPGHMPHDPTLVLGAEAIVTEEEGAIFIEIRATDDAAAMIIYQRAVALMPIAS